MKPCSVWISNPPQDFSSILDWLGRLISRRVPLERYEDAFPPQPDDVKVVITLDG